MQTMNLHAQLEELNLIRFSLLPGELFELSLSHDAAAEWSNLLETFAEGKLPDNDANATTNRPSSTCRFRIGIEDGRIAFEIELPRRYPVGDGAEEPPGLIVLVRGMDGVLEKGEQMKWQEIVKERLEQVREEHTEFITHILVSEHLLPLLHAEFEPGSKDGLHLDPSTLSRSTASAPSTSVTLSSICKPKPKVFHALLTSHHLISPTKRRSLQKWVSQLSLRGFAKVGYPGCIYVESMSDTDSSSSPSLSRGVDSTGDGEERVEEFVRLVKAMQWLNLRVRFVEEMESELEKDGGDGKLKLTESDGDHDGVDWIELEKVGEVVEIMRRSGRERYVTEMGLGSAGGS